MIRYDGFMTKTLKASKIHIFHTKPLWYEKNNMTSFETPNKANFYKLTHLTPVNYHSFTHCPHELPPAKLNFLKQLFVGKKKKMALLLGHIIKTNGF
jgi:hypothetical protein